MRAASPAAAPGGTAPAHPRRRPVKAAAEDKPLHWKEAVEALYADVAHLIKSGKIHQKRVSALEELYGDLLAPTLMRSITRKNAAVLRDLFPADLAYRMVVLLDANGGSSRLRANRCPYVVDTPISSVRCPQGAPRRD
eukprot:GHVU01034946.1.p3 GENE.GHVU01034946.1~~GHVU01034946.1.p3  ORF type:complete len:138 (-),score=22.68 GHVU01034946.1:1117-1530(-)